MKLGSVILGASLVVLCTVPSVTRAAGYIEKMDNQIRELQEVKTDAMNFSRSNDAGKAPDVVLRWAMKVIHEGAVLGAYLDEAYGDLEVDDNREFVKDSKEMMNRMFVNYLASLGEIEGNSRKGMISEQKSFADFAKIIDGLIGTYTKFRAQSVAHVQGLKREMESKSKEWNNARADDEDDYRESSIEMDSFLKANTEGVKKGVDLLREVKSASQEWARASNAGNKEGIERAYKRYIEVHQKLTNWKRAYSELNKKTESLFRENHSAWVGFVKEIQESIKLYDGEVAEANAAYSEYLKVMYGKN